MADMAGVVKEVEERNAELEAENARLVEENKHLNERIEKLRSNLANTVHNLTKAESGNSENIQNVKDALRECEKCLESTKTELKHVKKILFEKNRRYQEDCITINRLQVTVETLAESFARKTGRCK